MSTAQHPNVHEAEWATRWASRWSSPAREPNRRAWRCRGATTRAGRSWSAPKPRSASRSRTSSPTRPPRRSPAPAKRSSRCSSPRSSSGTRSTCPSDQVVAFAGHSLGQVTALIASGVLTLEDGVRFAARRAELTQAAADAHPGKMAALLGATPEQAEDACTAAPDGCWVANDNAPGQVVIAGTARRPRRRFRPGPGARRAPGHRPERRRRVPHPAHGRRHRRARHRGRGPEPGRPRRRPSCPTTTPQPYDDADGWRERLPNHVSVPVRWRSTMDTLVGLGADTFWEVGHGSMLAALAKRGAPDVTVRNFATPEQPSTTRPWRSHSPWKPS